MGQVFGRQDDDLAPGPARDLAEGRDGAVHSLGGEGFQLTVGQAHDRIRQRAQSLIEGLILRGNFQELSFELEREQDAGPGSDFKVPSDFSPSEILDLIPGQNLCPKARNITPRICQASWL